MTDKELARLYVSLAGVTCPEVMHGTSLAIVLCTVYENPDEEPNDTGWTQSALDGSERTLDAIHEHYAPTIERLCARAEAAEAERDENEAVIRVWRRRCGEAEAERDGLRAIVADLQARAALSGSAADLNEVTIADALEAAARIAERRHLTWAAEADDSSVDDDISACEDIARAIRLFATQLCRRANQAHARAALSGGDDG